MEAELSPKFFCINLTLYAFLLRDLVRKIILQHEHLISSVLSQTSHQLHRFSPYSYLREFGILIVSDNLQSPLHDAPMPSLGNTQI